VKLGYITGGLGNQLFQLAFNLNAAHDEIFYIEGALGKPRSNFHGKPDIRELSCPPQVKWASLKDRRLTSKVFSYGISRSAKEGVHLKNFNKIMDFAASVILSLHYKAYLKFKVSQGVGFNDLRLGKHYAAIGYFQSFEYSKDPSTFEKLMEMDLVEPTEEYLNLKSRMLIEQPTVVHVRLGDYINEPSIGILPTNYYFEAIKLLEVESNGNVWVFSDEIEIAKSKLSGALLGANVTWLNPDRLSAAETFMLLRHGSSYIIGNSTFSWWGAYLTYTKNAVVICPSPWFKMVPSPARICPPEWRNINYLELNSLQ
jgi:hypothetical protein